MGNVSDSASPRRLALGIIARCLSGTGADGGFSNILTDGAIRKNGLSAQDAALLTWLTGTVLEHKITIDYIIGQISSRPPDKIDPVILNTVRLGIGQLRYSDRIPVHAAVNETVNLAPKSARSFVNAVLRSYLRRTGDGSLAFPDRGTDLFGYMSVEYSVPEDLCRVLCSVYGIETAEKILTAGFRTPSLTLRVNTLRTERNTLREKLAGREILCELCQDSPYGIRLGPGSGIPEEIRDGLAYVQDESSQICPGVLAPEPGDKVLDACSCPGSKSFSAAMMMDNRGTVVSCDVHGSKLNLVKKGAERLGINIIKTVCRDSSIPEPTFKGAFDRVLCDVPCSGLGVMAGKPEIRYRGLSRSDELTGLQYSILSATAEAVRPGGVLVYSTCTLLPAENSGNVERFLSARREFTPEPFRYGSLSSEDGMLTILPDGRRDGFFIAKLRRKAE